MKIFLYKVRVKFRDGSFMGGISGKAAVRGQLFYIRLPHPSPYALWFKDGVRVTRYCSLRVGFSCANSTERWRRMG